jgi:transcriptional regulator with XRE-family HTH domain
MPGDEWGRRVRAALVLRGCDADDLARELNISRRTLDRMIAGKRAPRDWETARIEELLELPKWFIRDGLERPLAQGVESSVAVPILAALKRIETLLLRSSSESPNSGVA